MRLALLALGLLSALAPTASAAGWPEAVREVQFLSTADDTEQPAMFYAPEAGEPRPLLVALHTWSHDHRQAWSIRYAEYAMEQGWAFVHPAFRGPNNRPEATGSELAIQDVLSAVEYARANANVDPKRIYLIGFSSGGMLGLHVATRSPETWAGVSIWGPVVDLCRWYEETGKRGFTKYHNDVGASIGGDPAEVPAAAEQCRRRSPITRLAEARGVNIDLNVGIRDGHGGYDIVPVGHTLEAYNALAADGDRLTPEEVTHLQNEAAIPSSLSGNDTPNAAFGENPVLFHRRSGTVTLTVFQGGHKIVYAAALGWLGKQQRP